MSNFISKEVQVIFGAIKQALESEPNPGNSVNATDNPSQIGLIGRFNLHKAAEKVWDNLKAHFDAEEKQAALRVAAEARRVDAEAKAAVEKVEAEAKTLL
jgi:hypothetical protein